MNRGVEMIIRYPCHCNFSFFNPLLPFYSSTVCCIATLQPQSKAFCERLPLLGKLTSVRPTHVSLCSKNGVFEEFTDTLFTTELENEGLEELELLNRPHPKQVSNGSNEETVEEDAVKQFDEDRVLEPFYKFFRPIEDGSRSKESAETENEKEEEARVEYYEPKQGDFVVGVVVSGNENKLDVNVGADMLGTMLTKEILPLYDKEMDYLLCDVERDAEVFMARGKVGIVRNDEAIGGEKLPGKPVVDVGTVVFAEVLGRTLGGRPLLSTRRLFRRVAWHRVRQIKQLNEPIEVKITEWNTGGLLTRVEGLRAFLPKAELMNRVNNFTELKENVGRRMHVQITRINDATNDLIVSEKEAWGMVHLRPGTLVDGTVKKIFPYGAQIRIGETNRSGLLHISNITQGKITSVGELLSVGEAVKVLVVKSMFPDKISLSTADLESEPGLFMSNKERVFCEAEDMANKYRKKISIFSANRKLEAIPMEGLPFEDEEKFCSNWKWFQFETKQTDEMVGEAEER